MKERIHREWFRIVSLGGRKSCPKCKTKLAPGESVWSWGEYQYAKWRTVRYFCKECWPSIELDLRRHKHECGCQFELVAYHCALPPWLALLEGSLCSVSTKPEK